MADTPAVPVAPDMGNTLMAQAYMRAAGDQQRAAQRRNVADSGRYAAVVAAIAAAYPEEIAAWNKKRTGA